MHPRNGSAPAGTRGAEGVHGSNGRQRSTAPASGIIQRELPPQLVEDLGRLLGEALVAAVRRDREDALDGSPSCPDHAEVAS